MSRNWTVENLERKAFLCSNWDWRNFNFWVTDIKDAHRLTKDEAMHIVRSFPAIWLCARQIP